MATTVATEHPHVVRCAGTCDGEPIIKGTRTTVRALIGYYRLGMTAEDILEALPHLTPAQVYDALSYYHDHNTEIDQHIEANKIDNVTEELGLQAAPDGKLEPRRGDQR